MYVNVNSDDDDFINIFKIYTTNGYIYLSIYLYIFKNISLFVPTCLRKQ